MNKVTQREKLYAYIEEHGYITNRVMRDMGISHSGRNRLTDQPAKDYFKRVGLYISHTKAKNFLDSKWELLKIPEGQLELL